MSIKLMTQVWEHPDPDLKESTLLVLLVLADHANDDGRCWPSASTIGRKAKISSRHVTRVIAWLKEKGYVEVVREGKGRTSTMYLLHVESRQNVTPAPTPVSTQGGHSYVTPAPTPVSTKPLIEPSKEPSVSVRKRTARKKSEAVELFRQITNRYPNTIQEGAIDLRVTDLKVWFEVVEAWFLAGYSPVNVKGMLEWYEKGIPDNYTKKEKESERERMIREWKEAPRDADGKRISGTPG